MTGFRLYSFNATKYVSTVCAEVLIASVRDMPDATFILTCWSVSLISNVGYSTIILVHLEFMRRNRSAVVIQFLKPELDLSLCQRSANPFWNRNISFIAPVKLFHCQRGSFHFSSSTLIVTLVP